MEALVELFVSSFNIFCKGYVTPHIIYANSEYTMDVANTRYINTKIANTRFRKQATSKDIIIRYNKNPRYYIEFLVFYVSWIKYILNIIKPEVRDVRLKVYLTSFKKSFPGNQKMLEPYNVNSGVTFTYNHVPYKDVIVYREEEVFKVLMHELIHAFNIDSIYLDDRHEGRFREYFGRSCKLYLNESFTDTLACIYNCLSFSLILGRVKKDPDILSLFKMYLARERLYILEKSRDVLTYEGFKWDSGGITHKGKSTEETHVISYYILKALNFYYLNIFFEFLNSQGFHLKDENVYVDQLYMFLTRKDYWSYISRKKYTKFSSSLRMSDIDINILIYEAKDKLLKNIIH